MQSVLFSSSFLFVFGERLLGVGIFMYLLFLKTPCLAAGPTPP